MQEDVSREPTHPLTAARAHMLEGRRERDRLMRKCKRAHIGWLGGQAMQSQQKHKVQQQGEEEAGKP